MTIKDIVLVADKLSGTEGAWCCVKTLFVLLDEDVLIGLASYRIMAAKPPPGASVTLRVSFMVT